MPLRASCYNRALDALARRARSRAELRRWLVEREYAAEEVELVLDRLVAGRLLDDLAFARGFAHARLGAGRGYGPARVRLELMRRGVARDLIDRVLTEHQEESGVDSAQAVEVAARKRLRALAGLDPAVARRRLVAWLLRRGFPGGEATRVARELIGGAPHD
jgi:regulatory protein